MQAILLFSHGSVQCGAEENLLRLARAMEMQPDSPVVEVGFLNYSAPDLGSAVARCIARGATSIAVVPYFLVAGKFVVEDLPRAIDALRVQFTGIPISVADPIGFHSELAGIILQAEASARPPGDWLIRSPISSEFCRNSTRCPTNGTEYCPRSTEQK